jgi:hypothetical protein
MKKPAATDSYWADSGESPPWRKQLKSIDDPIAEHRYAYRNAAKLKRDLEKFRVANELAEAQEKARRKRNAKRAPRKANAKQASTKTTARKRRRTT